MITRAAFLLAAAFLTAPTAATASKVKCAPAPEPVVSLTYVSRYASDDATRSTIDPEREAEAEAAVAPVDDFIVTLAEAVDRMYAGPVPRRAEAAGCVVARLAEWAEADALSELETETVRLTIGSRYAAFALILWQTLPYAPDHSGRKSVLDWLDRRLTEQMTFWEAAPEGARQGNLRAWAGLAAAALAVQTRRDDLGAWSNEAISEVLCSANPDGSLPQEMTRDRLALHYQLHAVAPLVTAAALLELQGIPASRDCGGALHEVVDFTLADLDGGTRTARITGHRQSFFDGGDPLQTFQLAWIEPYLSLQDNEELAAMADRLGPLSYSKLGGNQTALWGH